MAEDAAARDDRRSLLGRHEPPRVQLARRHPAALADVQPMGALLPALDVLLGGEAGAHERHVVAGEAPHHQRERHAKEDEDQIEDARQLHLSAGGDGLVHAA